MRRSIAVLTLLIAAALARICFTYSTFNATYDEGNHIAAGIQWLDRGIYTYEYQHPPLARLAIAILPYLRGLRTVGLNQLDDEGTAILFSRGQYWSDLTYARIGNLPFLVLAAIVVFLWGRRWFSNAAGLWAALLLLCLPPILGHAGVATLDMACAALVPAALYQLMRWLETPTTSRAIRMGLTMGLAVAAKFSAIPFLGVCGIALILCLGFMDRPVIVSDNVRRRVWQIAYAAGAAFLILWACYRFSLQPASPTPHQQAIIDKRLGAHPPILKLANAIMKVPLPMTELPKGIGAVTEHDKAGKESFLLGERRVRGWWYFFPVVLAVKTPIGFLLLAFSGLAMICYRFRASPWQQRCTLLFPIALLLYCLTSHIDLGVRHILSIYLPLSVLAGHVIATCWANPQWRKLAVLPLALAAWTVVESGLAHPDYLAHFNAFAGSHPERILAESDLDWGQDLHRLSVRLNELHAPEVSIAYFGETLLDKFGLPPIHRLPAREPVHGWIAISVHYLTIDNARDGSFAWLKHETPVEIVGKSIWLYHLP